MIVDPEKSSYSRAVSAVAFTDRSDVHLSRLASASVRVATSDPDASYSRNVNFFKGTALIDGGGDPDKPTSSQTEAPPFTGATTPEGYKFNLPPHSWSLPLTPRTLEPETVGGTEFESNSFHGGRRGRIWYYQGAGDINEKSTENSPSSAEKMLLDRKYGFQFLWNPENVTTNVARNMDITPSAADTLRVVAGVFPGQETMSLSIVLDRTNDFAYGKAIGLPASPEYYGARFSGEAKQDFATQWAMLMRQGTMADLEYLFRAINGSGSGDKQWTTLLGKKTANVGYLQPTLMGIVLGPNEHDNLSYVGWISNIGITHTAFTETMIPIRTTVNISFECFSGSGISAG